MYDTYQESSHLSGDLSGVTVVVSDVKELAVQAEDVAVEVGVVAGTWPVSAIRVLRQREASRQRLAGAPGAEGHLMRHVSPGAPPEGDGAGHGVGRRDGRVGGWRLVM